MKNSRQSAIDNLRTQYFLWAVYNSKRNILYHLDVITNLTSVFKYRKLY